MRIYVWDGDLTCDVVSDKQTVIVKVRVKSKCVCYVDDETVINCQVLQLYCWQYLLFRKRDSVNGSILVSTG